MILRSICMLTMLLSLCTPTTWAATYAVLGYQGEDKPEAFRISEFVASRLGTRTGAKVLSYREATDTLAKAGCDSSQYESGREFCRKAGDILGVDYLVYGKTWPVGDERAIESHLVKSATGDRVGHALTQASPNASMEYARAIDGAVVELLGRQKKSAAATTRADLVGGSRLSSDSLWKWKTPAVDRILDHLEIGLRSTHFDLRDDKEEHFDANGRIIEGYLGSINELEPEPEYFPTLYANVVLLDWLALQLGYERFTLRTGRYWDDDTDGSFKFSGPSLTAQARYPNETRFTPYAGIGIMMLNVDFDMIGWWHHGFGGTDAHGAYRRWRDSGSPAWPNGGYQRNFRVVDDRLFKPVFQVGCKCRLSEHFSLDLDGRYVNLDSELHYTLSSYGTVFNDRGASDFPMDAWIIDIGLLGEF